jgi:hypothetical protein
MLILSEPLYILPCDFPIQSDQVHIVQKIGNFHSGCDRVRTDPLDERLVSFVGTVGVWACSEDPRLKILFPLKFLARIGLMDLSRKSKAGRLTYRLLGRKEKDQRVGILDGDDQGRERVRRYLVCCA